MFPVHCKEVSVKTVSFELNEANIKRFLAGKRAYIRTRYYVFNSGSDWAVALIVRKTSNDVLQEIASVHILSLPKDTAFIEDPSLDVLSASSMGAMRAAKDKKCIVVRGRSEHVSFFIDEPPYDLTIFDVVPPEPSKLEGLVHNVLETDLQDRYVRVKVLTLDLNSLANSAESGITMYPCRASGLKAGKNVVYLDETPELSPQQLDEVTLIGCSLSERIFEAVYGRRPRLINMCPQDLIREHSIQGPVLLKCCKVKEGFEVKGSYGVVPWGARAKEVSDALRAILR
ncbi:MAG: hypothetical protein A3K76_04860 [Euryarchaeota archaeon RBG_13_57_23]|nr:MAG: hypothetical protein A3K76_04860 [Euryarchaeota archaeon RBG_13_57_23]